MIWFRISGFAFLNGEVGPGNTVAENTALDYITFANIQYSFGKMLWYVVSAKQVKINIQTTWWEDRVFYSAFHWSIIHKSWPCHVLILVWRKHKRHTKQVCLLCESQNSNCKLFFNWNICFWRSRAVFLIMYLLGSLEDNFYILQIKLEITHRKFFTSSYCTDTNWI